MTAREYTARVHRIWARIREAEAAGNVAEARYWKTLLGDLRAMRDHGLIGRAQ